MLSVESELGLLRDPRLAAVATSAWPAWLWSTDASQILWANAAGAALFGAADTSACIQRRFDRNRPQGGSNHPSRGYFAVRRFAPPRTVTRLRDKLRPCPDLRLLARAASRRQDGVLVTATEPAGSALPLS